MKKTQIGRALCAALALGVNLVLASVSEPAAAACQIIKYAELPVTMAGTVPLIRGSINGMDAVFLADSGAFFSMVTWQSASKFNLRPSSQTWITGVGGYQRAGIALAKEFGLKGFGKGDVPRVQFLISGNSDVNSIDGVIGQNVLDLDGTEFDLGNGVIRLFRIKDCGDEPLAYWHGDADVSVVGTKNLPTSMLIVGDGLLNGSKIAVGFDTGSSHSTLTLKAAERVGIKTDSPGVVAGGRTVGIGQRSIETWIARFDSLELGGEKIKNPKLRFGDIELKDCDLILGADFFLSHRIFFAKGQRKVYFTYNGGHVFDLTVTPESATASTSSSTGPAIAVETPSAGDTPRDAAEFRRRGAALAARGDLPGAIADLDQAINLEPGDAENYYQRAMVRLSNGKKEFAVADLDQALKLKSDYVEALKRRGSLKLSDGDDSGARADFDATLAATPNDPGLWLNVAKLFLDAHRYESAIHFLDRWIDTYPNDFRYAGVLNSRCWARGLSNQQLDLAMADCNASLKLSFDPATLDSRGLVWLRLGDAAQALSDYKYALNRLSIQRRPSDAWTLFGKGLAELRLDKKTDGQKDINAAVAISPTIADDFKKIGLTP